MKSADIRRAFLDFFRDRGHRVVPSSSLIPEDPRAPMLTTAGMVQFIPYFLGERPVENPRAASCQKVARTTDIEEVGLDARHQSFFEMLGNFSFGDYYKREAIRWAWELSTGPFGLDPGRIWVTVYETDEEAAAIWREEAGLPDERIIRRGKEDNFWWMGVAGPGGPCSELFYDRGPEFGEVEGFQDGDRIMEYWNLVFTEKQVDDSGEPVGDLPRSNVDTGLGLERLAQILQGVPTAYELDTLAPMLARAGELAGRAYGSDEAGDVSLRIMADHGRFATFLIADGVSPSNEGRGYVLRRVLRRAVRHARLLGIERPVMPALVDAVVETMGDWYPELGQNRAYVEHVASQEEENFLRTLRAGLALLEEEIEQARAEHGTALGGRTSFKLHDTYGFPLDLTIEIAAEAGLSVDREEFDRLMEEQRRRARDARKDAAARRSEDAFREILHERGASRFDGYEADRAEGLLVGLVGGRGRASSAAEGEEVDVVLDRTPFYPEGGGQIGDAGRIIADGAELEVVDTARMLDDLIVHRARVVRGEISVGTRVAAEVDAPRRAATMRSHTATHMVHWALRDALGPHARQAGSLVAPGRLRFDFRHSEAVPGEVLDRVEEVVNARLVADDAVRPYETTMEEARNRGAVMLFEEKYGDIVRVVEVGDYSIELCGGTHVTHTSQVGVIKILGEASIGSGLRRIEALTGLEGLGAFRRERYLLDQVAAMLKSGREETPEKVRRLLERAKQYEDELRRLRGASQREQARELAGKARRIGDVDVVAEKVPGLGMQDLQQLATAVREAIGRPAAVVLGSAADDRVALVAALTRDLAGNGRSARALIADAAKAIGGGAGGKDEMATGGGKRPEALDDALRLAAEAARAMFT